jgi:hypothetical protein
VRLRVRSHEPWVLWGKPPRASPVVPGTERVRGRRPAVLTGRARDGRALRKEVLLSFAWA